MKIITSTIILASMATQTKAHCGNSEPQVLGFNSAQPFSKPPDNDGCLLGLLGCVSYATDTDISYETYSSSGDKTTVNFKATDYYSGDDLTLFKEMCEDLWILNDMIAQDAAIDGDYTYDSKGLCFDTDPLYDPDLNSGRAQFIIESCHGSDPCEESDAPSPCDSADERLARLSEELETTAAYAEDRARRQTFNTDESASYSLAQQLAEAEDLWDSTEGDPSEICGAGNSDCSAAAAVCRELQACYTNQFETGLFAGLLGDDYSTSDLIDDSFVYSQCFNVTYEDLVANADGVCSEASTDGDSCSPYSITDGVGFCGEGGNPTEPVCPTDFQPFFDSFPPAYPNPSDNPSYGDAVLSIQDLYLCSAGGDIDYTDRTSADNVGITLIVRIALEGTKIAAELFKDSLPHWPLYIFKVYPFQIIALAQDAVNTVLEQTALHDGLVDGAEMEAVYENTLQLLKGSQAIYDEVVCRCTSSEQIEPLRGQGCDSIDNDCDDFVDECDEDTFKPEIDISAASLNCASGNGQTNWFTTDEDALSCVSTYASIEDDCDTAVTIDATTLDGTCGAATITLEGSDRCGNAAEPKVVPVFIDKVPPVVACGVGADESKTFYLEDSGAGVMTDVNLLYDGLDNCGFDMDVSVNVYSNEIEDFHNQDTAILYRNGLWNDRVGLYVAAQYCVTDANGQCIKDPIVDTRVYTIVISATDEAGNEATVDECQVVILPTGKTEDDYPSLSSSTQRFHLASYTSTFTNYLSTVE